MSKSNEKVVDNCPSVDFSPVVDACAESRVEVGSLKSSLEAIFQAASEKSTTSLITATDSISTKVLEHSSKTSGVLEVGFESVEKAISSIPEGSYPLALLSAAFSAVIAAAVAFFLNYLYWDRVNRHNRLSHFATVSIEHLHDFEESAVSYWISNRNSSNSQSMIKLEIRIKTQYFILKRSLEELAKRLPEKCEEDKEEIIRLINEIYDDATGDNFESHEKIRQKRLALKISRKCLEIKSILILYTQKLNS